MHVLWVYGVLALANVSGHLLDAGWLVTATKPLLMPVLAVWLVRSVPPTRRARLAAVALGLSWLGDLALMGDGERWFLLGMGAFALAQIVYAVGFLPAARRGLLRRRPALAAPYALAWVALMPFLASRVGALFLPASGAIVMATYAAAQGLIALGVRAHAIDGLSAVPAGRGRASPSRSSG